jgi:hypothetical protein
VKATTQGVELGGAGRPDVARFNSGAAGMGWDRELIGGAHASARGGREDAEDGRRKSKRKTYSQKYANG